MRDLDTMMLRLAENRRQRLRADGRPVFDLTHDEVESSTRTAMRLAQASTTQAEAAAPFRPVAA